MDSKDPDELITEVQEEQQTRGELAKDALQWFLDGNVGELFPRDGVVEELSEELDISTSRANTAISDTVGDIVDPVQQITRRNSKYVGVIDYQVFSDEGAYGYVDFDDRKGERKRVVCARCVEKHKYDENITHATQGEGSSSIDATWQQLLNKVTAHYADQHTKAPSEIEPGASLVSGTTISGNTAFHAGNDGSGSGLDADTVDGAERADLKARDVARNAQGQVQFTQAGQSTTLGTQSNTVFTTQVQESGRVMYDFISGVIGTGNGQMTLKRNGATVQGGSPPISASGSPSSSNVTWTMSMSFTSGLTPETTKVFGGNPLPQTTGTTNTSAFTSPMQESWSRVKITLSFYTGLGADLTTGTAYFSYNGNLIDSAVLTPNESAVVSTSKDFTPNDTFTKRVHADGSGTVNLSYVYGTLYRSPSIPATLKASKNDVVTIE